MSALCDADTSALLVIDLQARLMPAIHEGQEVLAAAHRLAQVARMVEVPVIGTLQNREKLGAMPDAITALCDRLVGKTSFDACAEDGLIDALPGNRRELIVTGCEAHVCVLQTVLGLRARGLRVRIAADATGSRRPSDKSMALQRMQAAGAELLTTEMVMFEWLRGSGHPRFRDMLKLIR
jgi:nicotinamidase-related amidase